MSDERPKCGLCGHPMPKGEEMFKFHGYSGPCPGPRTKPMGGVPEVIELHGEKWVRIDVVRKLEERLAAAEARSYERIAEIDEIREQLANAREGDNWVLMARESIANGNCPWCFCMDEGPHQPGCYVNEIEAENSRLHRELCEMSEPRLKLHATIQQLAERLAAATAAARFYARYYDGPAESLLGEEDRKAFQWVELNRGEP